MITPAPATRSKGPRHTDSLQTRWRDWLHGRSDRSMTVGAVGRDESNDELDGFEVGLAEGWSPFCGGPCLLHEPMFVLRATEPPAASGPAG